MKSFFKTGITLGIIVSVAILFQSCASSNHCGCTDLSKHYKAPKSHKRNVF